MYGANESAELEDRTLPRYIRITDVKEDGTLHEDTFRSLEEDVAAPYLLEDGDILLARSGATVGKSFQYLKRWGRAAYAGYLIRFRPDQDVIVPRFASYYFKTAGYWACINSSRIQATIENFSAEKYKDLNLPLPEKGEQQQIAAFLDWKTGQIDALIARKGELLEKLKEKRLAVITQAVTKGLNPDATLRDSGISWLGQVPAHWEVKKLKFIGDPIIGLTYDPDDIVDEKSGTLVLRANNIQDGKLVRDDPVYVAGEIPAALRLQVGDIMICSRNGSRKLIGKNGRVTAELAGATFGAFNTIFRSEANTFLYWVLNSSLFDFHLGSYLTSTINQLTISNLNSIVVPLPPPDEQKEISKVLEVKIAELDRLASMAHSAITHLTEYRTALITAATTGKIDVRNVKVPSPTRP
jgi:type I restriction enzyme S subunit